MTILVTGATGTVGNQVLRQLLDAGHPVRALTRDPAKAKNLPDGVEVFAGNLADPESLEAALTGVSGVFLYTSDGSEVLTNGPELVGRLAKSGVKRVVALWSGFDGSVITALRGSDLEWTVLQPQEFMANALTWVDSIKTEGVVREPFAEVLSAAIHEADIGAVAVVTLTQDGHHGRDYELNGPQALSFLDKTRILTDALGREVRYEELTRQQAHDRLTAMGVSSEMADHVVDWHADPPAAAYTVNHMVEKLTGQPGRDYTQWVAENVDAFR
ncbi:NAD(P)H-binding protein [Stackebrandtia nassauensis]|uniref:NmrA family protein n=1 Tax=Stackebrandtia nassauensis (strain DSM 44728 / CIP 108903 / NRRL B-16338 / NBRC 102104 / LLR-40K-21) TaxID=446470 RepID=D3QC06_STANL|nr:NAD(P)H-binding protein [Stackebrandtia nassauensis]ADD44895.1 NmrA family protein [Stackebrandtia nassauensis DSM 44728]